jgi:hypothetical protein
MVHRGVDAVKRLLRKLLKCVPGARRLNNFRLSLRRARQQQERALDLLEQMLTLQEQLLGLQRSTLHAVSTLLESQRRQEYRVPHLHTQMLRCFAQIQERLDDLKRPPVREAA